MWFVIRGRLFYAPPGVQGVTTITTICCDSNAVRACRACENAACQSKQTEGHLADEIDGSI